MMKSSVLKLASIGAVAAILSSCASISVVPVAEHKHADKPKKIYVSLFNASKGEFNVDREKTDLVDFKKHLQSTMQQVLVSDLTSRLITATPAPKGREFDQQEGWLIRGEFTKVNQGSRFLRGTVGFGAGGTKMETKVYVYDLSESTGMPILEFKTTGGSNAEPGAISAASTVPWQLAIQIALCGAPGVAHGVTEDADRTAREITAELSDYMYKHGWISKDKWIKPKPLT